MGVRKESDVENQIGFQGHAMLVAKADQMDIQAHSPRMSVKAVHHLGLHLVNGILRRVNDDVGQLLKPAQPPPFKSYSFTKGLLPHQGVGPTSFAKTADKDGISCLEIEDEQAKLIFLELDQQSLKISQSFSCADINDECDSLDFSTADVKAFDEF